MNTYQAKVEQAAQSVIGYIKKNQDVLNFHQYIGYEDRLRFDNDLVLIMEAQKEAFGLQYQPNDLPTRRDIIKLIDVYLNPILVEMNK